MTSQSEVQALPRILTSTRDSPRADRTKVLDRRGIWAGRLLGGVIAAIGAVLAAGGLWLILLGGSLYYLMSGIGYVVVGVLLSRRRPAGALLAVALLAPTLAWALWEAGLDYWALFPRVLLPAGLALLALLAALRFPANESRRVTASVAGALALAIAVEFAFAFVPHGVVHNAPSRAFVFAEKSAEPSDWSSYGRTTAGTRYSPFTQINRENVGELQHAWTFRSGDDGPGTEQNTPLQIGDHVYTCSRNGHLAALDADTGAVRWRYDVGVEPASWSRCRGLGYYELPDAPRERDGRPDCARRIFVPTIDARLIALDASTGQPCPDFGRGGVVDLKQGMGPVEPGFYFQSSAPVVARGRIIVGGFVADNVQAHIAFGCDPRLRRPDGRARLGVGHGQSRRYARSARGQATTRAARRTCGRRRLTTTRSASCTRRSATRHPTTSASDAIPASERYNSSITALDIETGRPRWSVQTVHHDIWDYDVPSQPALVDLPDGHGGTVPALLQTTKRGQLFLLNRATGEAISRIVERPVPQNGAVPEERLSPTQPYSVDMPAIGAERLAERNAWGMTTLDQLWCRISFRQHRYDGEFTPIGLDPSLQYPGPLGGLNWGSVSVDPLNHIAFMNDLRMASSRTLVPRDEYAKWAARYPELGLKGHGAGLQPQAGTPYGVLIQLWVSPLGVPCNQLPLGTISAVDLVSGKLLWQVPAGTSEDTGPLGIVTHLPMPVGMPTYAGTSVTAGGLVFFAGTQDFYLRAYDAANRRRALETPAARRFERNADDVRLAEHRPSVRRGLGGRGRPVAQDRRLPDGFRAAGAQAVSREHQRASMTRNTEGDMKCA